jgi:pyridoxamine 5'-phosphate oxidase
MAEDTERSGSQVGLRMEEAAEPLPLFTKWMEDAKVSELNDPNAMSLATATPEGAPSVRIVLLKRFDRNGFAFYTNGESRKGAELRANQRVALCLHWKSRQRQVRIEGAVTELPPEDVDAYFAHRPRMSQIGAWASQQSRPLQSRDELIALTEKYEAEFPREIPRPPYWTGFLVKPSSIEFWQEGAYRLHDRFVFTANGDGWAKQRLFP